MNRPVRVLVTQGGTTGSLAALLRARGADVWELPMVRIEPPPDWRDADAALRTWDSYDWIVFTSANAVRAVAGRLAALDLARQGSPRIAAVGPATGAALEKAGWTPVLVPKEHSGEALAALMVEREPLTGARVLFPRGNLARDVVPEALRSAGARVREVIVYETVPVEVDGPAVRARLAEEKIDAVAFTSPSAVESFVRSLGKDIWGALPSPLVVASIGPTTSQALREAGRAPDCSAPQATMDALADAVVRAVKETRA